MFKNLISKASELGKKAQTIATGYLAKPDPNQPEKRTENQSVNDEKMKEILLEIQNIKEICQEEFEKKITEVSLENEMMKNELNSLVSKKDSLESELKNTNEEYNNYKTNSENTLKLKENEIKELEEKIIRLNKKQIELQEEKFKSNLNEDCAKIENKHNELIEAIKSINLTEVFEEIKKNVEGLNNSPDSSFLNTLNTKSNDIANLINTNEQLNDDDKNKLNQSVEEQFKELQTNLTESLKDSINQAVCDIVEKKMKESFEKSSNLIIETKGFISEGLSKIQNTLEDYNKESLQLKEINNDLMEKYTKETQKYEEEKRALEGSRNETKNLEVEIKKKENIVQEKDSMIKNLETKITSLEEEKKNISMSLETLKINFKNSDNLCNDLCEKIKNLEAFLGQTSKNLEEKTMKFETSKQIIKNIFTLYLEEEYFIDSIERCFKNQDLVTDDTLKTSKIIKINLVVKLYKHIFNEIIKPKLCKFKVFEKILNELNNINYEFKSIDQFYSFSEKLLTDDNNILNRFIVELLEAYENQSKTIIELKENLRKSKDMIEEGKKTDQETKELLTKQISKLQGDCKEYGKTEKSLRETIDSLENNLKEEKSEVVKMNTKYKNLKQNFDNLEKEFNSVKENLESVNQKNELYKLENSELMEKFKDKSNELQNEKENFEVLLSENKELQAQAKELDKARVLIREKADLLNSKDIEINKLKNSYQSLEDIFENLKDQQEKEKESLKQQLLDSIDKKNELEMTMKILEEKQTQSQQVSLLVNQLNDRINDLESENNKLKEQKAEIKRHAEEVLIKVKNDLKDTEFLIDKRIISNFLLKYLDKSSNDKIKSAVLDTLSNFLGFTNEERKKVGLSPSTGMNFSGVSQTDKLKDISDNLYNFILNA